ncbi:MAG TPA: YHS domain-containing protein [Gammaproteobacteria bacterium]|nr:YHS domain-containing protein [Gammaproteobacteria bacterium]
MVSPNDLCPVCGMKSKAEVLLVEYHKMNFYFCSEQCRETFIAHPAIYSARGKRKPGEILKQRTIHLKEPLNDEVAELLIPYLNEMMGVKAVVVEGNKVIISYDLLQVTEMQIEKALVEVGLQLGGGWLQRLCRGWVHNSEEIEQDNRAAPPAPCCNKPPPGT